MMRGQPGVLQGLVLLVLPGLAACAPSPTPPAVVELPPTSTLQIASPTPEPTGVPTPAPLLLWASPGLPPDLLNLAGQVTEVSGRPVTWVDDPLAAELRLEPNAEFPLTQWVYALVASFPTLEEGITAGELRQIWSGEAEGTLYLTGETGNALVVGFGAPGSGLQIHAAGDLLDLAWQEPGALAIVPFDHLEPRWKVLAVDGRSPVRKGFEPGQYPLTVSFGLSGEPSMFDPLAAQLNWPATNRDPEKLTIVLMTGVTALTRGTAFQMELYGPQYPGFEIGDWFRSADLAHISHEASFSERCPYPDPVTSSLRFCASPEYLVLFEALGIDLIELTGNHLLDYGAQDMLYSLARYRDLGMRTFGGGSDLVAARKPALIEHNGNQLAFLGCNEAGPADDWASENGPGALSCREEGLLELVSELRDQGRLVIFTFQWPESVETRPLPRQVDGFRDAAEAGAVIVSGSQAHLPQTLEFHEGSFIHYGLGNLFFDQMYTLAYRQEFLDRHVFYDGRHISTELLTALLEDYAQPRPMTSEERNQFLERIFSASGW